MLARDPHAQDSGPDAEAQRRVEHERLAVDAGGDGPVGVDLEARRRPLAPRPLQRPAALAAPRGLADDRDPEQAVVDPRPRARADGAAEPVAVVGDEHHRARVVRVPARAGPAQVELAAVGAEHVGHGVEQRAQLRVAVALALDGLGVEPERDVVDEHAPVDLGQVHGALAAVDERVEGADDVVAVDAEVEREVVARAGGHARVGQPALGGDRRDDRLRAVAAGHRERVGAALDRPANERLEVLAGLRARSARSRARAPRRRARSAPPCRRPSAG